MEQEMCIKSVLQDGKYSIMIIEAYVFRGARK